MKKTNLVLPQFCIFKWSNEISQKNRNYTELIFSSQGQIFFIKQGFSASAFLTARGRLMDDPTFWKISCITVKAALQSFSRSCPRQEVACAANSTLEAMSTLHLPWITTSSKHGLKEDLLDECSVPRTYDCVAGAAGKMCGHGIPIKDLPTATGAFHVGN